MEREYRPRPPVPVIEQSEGDQSGTGNTAEQQFALGNPVDFVAGIRTLIAQAREARQRRGFSEFYPPFWMYDKLALVGCEYSPSWRNRVKSDAFQHFAQTVGINPDNINTRDELTDEELNERSQFYHDIATAYGIAAYSQFTPMQKDCLRKELRTTIRNEDIGSVILSEQQREVLGYITTATDTPFDPEQSEYHFFTVLRQPDITEKEIRENPGYSTW